MIETRNGNLSFRCLLQVAVNLGLAGTQTVTGMLIMVKVDEIGMIQMEILLITMAIPFVVMTAKIKWQPL